MERESKEREWTIVTFRTESLPQRSYTKLFMGCF